MTCLIRHIGKKDKKNKTSRYKRLVNSGIFRDNDTRFKKIDCNGDFVNWTNQPAKDWIMARVKEINDGRYLDISCDCCETIINENASNNINEQCYAKEIIYLIKHIASLEEKSTPNN
tara:strand:+ start:406 stop:756 length:351 start_codon:yes stop_codon:yes gene_type:complete